MLRKRLGTLRYEITYILCNYIVCNIPCWVIRKFLYRLMGMKIGKRSRILMKTKVVFPWKIKIGDRSIINENCYLDGRGTLVIGDDVSISFNTKVLTASHDIKDSDFRYVEKAVKIKDRVFIGIDSILLTGVVLEENVVIAAGSVVKTGVYSRDKVYSGVPAVYVKDRNLEGEYKLGTWLPWFI